MKRTIRQLLLPAVILAVLVPAAPASADWQAVLRDCVYNEGIQGDYKRSELQQAKRHVTGERLAYTECLAEISAAMSALPGAGGGDGKGKGAGGKSADLNGDGVVTPAEKKKAKRAAKRKKQAVASVNDSLTPDAIGSAGGDSSGGVSGGLIVALILLALAAAAGATWYAAQRNPTIANALRRVPVPGRRG